MQEKESNPTYVFKYFNGRGRGEAARLTFALAQKQYTDKRYTSEEWKKDKDKTPQKQLPLLEVDGFPVTQSGAIIRYLGRIFKKYGVNPSEEAQVDVVLETEKEFFSDHLMKLFSIKGEEEKAEMKSKMINEIIPKYCGIFEDMLEENRKSGNDEGWIVGKTPTIADVVVYYFTDTLKMKMLGLPQVTHTGRLAQNVQQFAALPGVKEWLESRPETDF